VDLRAILVGEGREGEETGEEGKGYIQPPIFLKLAPLCESMTHRLTAVGAVT